MLIYADYWGWGRQDSFNLRKDQVVYVNENSVTSFAIPCIANLPTVNDTILRKEEPVGLQSIILYKSWERPYIAS